MTAPAAVMVDRDWFSDPGWDEIARRAPQLAATLRRLLVELQRTAAWATIDAAERALRQFAGHITEVDPRCRSIAKLRRAHIENYLVWAAAVRPGRGASRMSPVTLRQRLA
jgi:hypothetical protein